MSCVRSVSVFRHQHVVTFNHFYFLNSVYVSMSVLCLMSVSVSMLHNGDIVCTNLSNSLHLVDWGCFNIFFAMRWGARWINTFIIYRWWVISSIHPIFVIAPPFFCLLLTESSPTAPRKVKKLTKKKRNCVKDRNNCNKKTNTQSNQLSPNQKMNVSM